MMGALIINGLGCSCRDKSYSQVWIRISLIPCVFSFSASLHNTCCYGKYKIHVYFLYYIFFLLGHKVKIKTTWYHSTNRFRICFNWAQFDESKTLKISLETRHRMTIGVSECVLWKNVLKNFKGKHLCRSLFLIKFQAFGCNWIFFRRVLLFLNYYALYGCSLDKNTWKDPEAYSEPSRLSKMEVLAKIFNAFQLLTIFAKGSILDLEWVLHSPLGS